MSARSKLLWASRPHWRSPTNSSKVPSDWIRGFAGSPSLGLPRRESISKGSTLKLLFSVLVLQWALAAGCLATLAPCRRPPTRPTRRSSCAPNLTGRRGTLLTVPSQLSAGKPQYSLLCPMEVSHNATNLINTF